MAFRLETEIDDAPDDRRHVSTHVVTEQVVSKKEIAGPPQDLFGALTTAYAATFDRNRSVDAFR